MEAINLLRKQSAYSSVDESFEIQKEMYRGQQYSQIYFARLDTIRTLLYSRIPNWKSHLTVCTVLGLEQGKQCIIVGTPYKHMRLKPSIFDEYSKEDESGRIKLGGTMLSPLVYVTGVVVALHGRETSAGEFFVEDVLEAGLPPQIDLPIKSPYNTFRSCTIPQCFELDNIRFLGTSDQNIDDLAKYSEAEVILCGGIWHQQH